MKTKNTFTSLITILALLLGCGEKPEDTAESLKLLSQQELETLEIKVELSIEKYFSTMPTLKGATIDLNLQQINNEEFTGTGNISFAENNSLTNVYVIRKNDSITWNFKN